MNHTCMNIIGYWYTCNTIVYYWLNVELVVHTNLLILIFNGSGTPIKPCTHTIFIRYNQLNGKHESLHGTIDHRVDQLLAERLQVGA